jgi:hypothetical protein
MAHELSREMGCYKRFLPLLFLGWLGMIPLEAKIRRDGCKI